MNHCGYSLPPSVRGRWPIPWTTPPTATTRLAPSGETAAPQTVRREPGHSEATPGETTAPATRTVRVELETILDCSADVAWREVQTSRLLSDVCFPIVMFGRVDGQGLPDQWPAGESIHCRSYLFGMIPLGKRRIQFERIDHEAREIQSRESDSLVARWDHLIRIAPLGPGQCVYRDEVDIEAGRRTGIVAWFARKFYSHRQRRWQDVARLLTAYE